MSISETRERKRRFAVQLTFWGMGYPPKKWRYKETETKPRTWRAKIINKTAIIFTNKGVLVLIIYLFLGIKNTWKGDFYILHCQKSSWCQISERYQNYQILKLPLSCMVLPSTIILALCMSLTMSQWIAESFPPPLSLYALPRARWIVPEIFSSNKRFFVNLWILGFVPMPSSPT